MFNSVHQGGGYPRREGPGMEWIKVEDRVPVETFTGLVPSTIVLCFGNGGRFFTAIYADGYFMDSYGDEASVSHWMPLPDPPK